MDEASFLSQIRRTPNNDQLRLIYADWLEEQGRSEAELLRTEIQLYRMPVDDPGRLATETRFSLLSRNTTAGWPRKVLRVGPACGDSSGCVCLNQQSTLSFHRETQDTECAAWHQLLDLIQEAHRNGDREFAPLRRIEQSHQIIKLPPDIGLLKDVRRLSLDGSHLTAIPPQIGVMESLEELILDTSYHLHWFPWEISKCTKLRDSVISTRVLYGNAKTRIGFPPLGEYSSHNQIPPKTLRPCSVCLKPFADKGAFRVWISRRIATDVIPMLVNACSQECLEQLPRPAANHISHIHRGGRVVQPPSWG